MCHSAQGLPAQCSTNIEQFPDMSPGTLTAERTTLCGGSPIGTGVCYLLSVAWRVCYSRSLARLWRVSRGVAPTLLRGNGSHRRAIRLGLFTEHCTAVISVPENPADMSIRRDLNRAIARDTDLRRSAEISFIVANGDVSVTGTVRTETERRKINDLAMNIGGVKSVANALLSRRVEEAQRVSEGQGRNRTRARVRRKI